MTILHVETGRHLYGGALQVKLLLDGLATMASVRSLLVAPLGSAIADAVAAEGHTEVVTLPLAGEHDIGFIWRLRRVIVEYGVDLVHLHSRRGGDWFGGMAAVWAGVPCLLTRRVDNPETRLLVPWKYRLFDRVVAISEGIADVLRQCGVTADKVTTVHSAIPDQAIRRCDRQWLQQQFGIRPEQPVVAVIAQLIPRKGHRYLIAAIPAIMAAQPDVHFLFLGQGAQRQALEQACYPFADAVTFAGFRDDLAMILPCPDLVVHLADREGLGVSLLQAAQQGKAIVATATGGIPEIVVDGLNGTLLPVAPAAEQVASAVINLLQHGELRDRMGMAGRERVVQYFSVEAMVAGNVAVYNRLIKNTNF